MTSPIPKIQVHIIGAGIAGLVLTRALLHHGIKPIISDKSRDIFSSPRNHHGIILHPASYRPLLPLLGLDDAGFKRKVAVDAGINGQGRINGSGGGGSGGDDSGFRANRGKFERLLAEGLEIGWEREVVGVKTSSSTGSRGIEVKFKDGENWMGGDGAIVVGADGPHSIVREKEAAASSEVEVLPFAVYNGKRKYTVGGGEAAGKIGKLLEENELEVRFGEVRLWIGVDDRTDEVVRLSYTFSRPARRGGEEEEEDGLFRPRREKSAATDIPEGLFEEIEGLRDRMDDTFREVFDARKMRNDRLLNWLMRRVDVGNDGLEAIAKQGIVLIGDSVHADPILGGQGANEAIEDGLKLAENISSGGLESLRDFYGARQAKWTKEKLQSRSLIDRMHSKDQSNL